MQIVWMTLLCLASRLSCHVNAKNETETNLFILMNQENYKTELEKYPIILILALSRNCRLCYEQLPMYEKVRVELKQNHRLIPIAKYVIDDPHDQFVQQFNFTTTPFFLLKNGDIFARAEHFNSHHQMVNWVQQNLSTSFESLDSVEQYYHISKKHLATVIWFQTTLADDSQTKFLSNLRGQMHFIRVYRSVSKNLSDFLVCPPNHIFIKYSGLENGHCEPSSDYEKIKGHLELYDFEHEHELTNHMMRQAFRASMPLMIYVSKFHEVDEHILSLAKFYQSHFKRQMTFCIAVLADREVQRVLYYFRIHHHEGQFFLVEPAKRLKGKKFVVKFEGDFSKLDDIEDFYKNVREENIVLYE